MHTHVYREAWGTRFANALMLERDRATNLGWVTSLRIIEACAHFELDRGVLHEADSERSKHVTTATGASFVAVNDGLSVIKLLHLEQHV